MNAISAPSHHAVDSRVSMVFDHRVCDGDVPSEFIGFVARCIENPIALLGAP